MFKVAKLEFKSRLISESNILIFKGIFRKRENQIVTLFFFPPQVGGSTPCDSVRTSRHMRIAEASSREGGVQRNSTELVLTSAAAAPISSAS